jgi:hypothetical protein
MKRKLSIVFLIVAAFIASFGLAKYLSKGGLSLPMFLSQSMYWFESLFEQEPALPDDSLRHKQALKEQARESNYQHIEVGNTPICLDTSLGKVKYKKVGEVYTWTDENGTPHFSDTPPNKGDYIQLNYAGEKVLDYFLLDLNTESLPYDFNQKLTIKLNKLFALYGKLLDVSSLKKVDINLQVVANKVTYQNIQKAHNMAIGNQSNGFYSHASNKAYLLYTNDQQVMKTAIHEATHAINRAIIGYSPKWLNEGLAEYSETINVSAKAATIHPNGNWTNNGLINEKLLPLDVLFSAGDQEWNGQLRQRLYASSWAFIYFMMEQSDRRNVLARLINMEQINVCDVVKKDSLESIFSLPIRQLQMQFSKWSQGKLRAQVI